MSQSIRLYSFADVDRSGKVRWAAREIGLDVEESRLETTEVDTKPYQELNPYAQVPAVQIDSQSFIESTAICLVLAERHPGAGLIPVEAEQREAFWQSIALTTTTLEQPAVNYALSKWGIIDERWVDLLEKPLKARMETFANQLPGEAYLHGAFTLADIFAAYVLRLAIQSGILQMRGNLASYINRLRKRPAAVQARFFDSMKS